MSRGTPQRGVRIEQELWEQVATQAAADGITVSDLVRGLLHGWLDGRGDNDPYRIQA